MLQILFYFLKTKFELKKLKYPKPWTLEKLSLAQYYALNDIKYYTQVTKCRVRLRIHGTKLESMTQNWTPGIYESNRATR